MNVSDKKFSNYEFVFSDLTNSMLDFILVHCILVIYIYTCIT